MNTKEKHKKKDDEDKLHDDKKTTALSKETASDGRFISVILNILDIMFIVAFNYFRVVGIYTIKVFRKICRIAKIFYIHILEKPVLAVEHFILKIVAFFLRGVKFGFFKLYMFLKFFIDANNVVKNGFNKRPKSSFMLRLLDAIVAFFKGVYNNRRIFITWLNYCLPVVSIVVLINIITYAASLNYAVSVECNGSDLGYIENESVFEAAETGFQNRLTYTENDEVIETVPKFALAIVPLDRLKDDLQITDALMKSSNEDIVKATGITIDGKFYGAVKEGYVIRDALDDIKSEYKTPDVISAEFVNDISLDTGQFMSKNIKEEEEIIKLITGKEQQDAYVNILEGDTPILIAARNDLSLEEFVKLNPGIIESCVVGRPVLVKKSKSYLPVSVTKKETYIEELDYKTITSKSSKLFSGLEEVNVEGKEGEKQVLAEVKYVDGVEISREVIETNIIKQAVDRQVTVGTATPPEYSGGSSGSGGNSNFIWPSSGGYISSPFGQRGRAFHSGIDYATSYGTPVVASLSGTVVTAGWSGSYGNLVVIDHGGGLQTRYAHNSSIKVRVGQTVKQGQQIARVGSTGNSSGNHVHFEVRVNGAARSPTKYLP